VQQPVADRSRGRIHAEDLDASSHRLAEGSHGRRGATKERILDAALSLFTDVGYERTSLREVGDAVGITKAAIYFHFESKEDILLALHARKRDLGGEALRRFARPNLGSASIEEWVAVIDEFIDSVVDNRQLFLLHVRNWYAVEQLIQKDERYSSEESLEVQLRRVFTTARLPLGLRVRMACSIGAVMTPLLGAAESFADVPADELVQLVRAAVRDLLGASDSPSETSLSVAAAAVSY
jgi:AcrR family transcriptional regulator